MSLMIVKTENLRTDYCDEQGFDNIVSDLQACSKINEEGDIKYKKIPDEKFFLWEI